MKLLAVAFIAILASTNANSQQVIGKWQFDAETPDVQLAKTYNDSGSSAGVLCLVSSNLCSAYVGSGTDCDEDARYPLLLNSATGAYLLTSTCAVFGKNKYLFIDDAEFGKVVAAFESGGEVGFAMPLQSGQFSVVRFSSAGATAAIRLARAVPTRKSTVNQTL